MPSLSMPNKRNRSRRQHIRKMKFQVTNGAECDAGLQRPDRLDIEPSRKREKASSILALSQEPNAGEKRPFRGGPLL